MSNVQKETYVEGLGTIYFCNDSAFDTALKAVLKKSDELISFRDLAYARIQDAEAHGGNWKESSLCAKGSYVKEGSLFVPIVSNKKIWLRESLVLKNPSDAFKAHIGNKEYLLKRFNVESHLEKVSKDGYFILTGSSAVPTNRFGEDARMVWAFGDQAKEYGKLLQDAKVSQVGIYMHTGNDAHIYNQSRPFANQLWLRSLGDYSGIMGDVSLNFRNIYNSSTVRGVQRIGEDDAKKSVETYSRKDISSALEDLKLSGLEESIFEKLGGRK